MATQSPETAIYLVIRRDLKMRRGKEIAQACHAAIQLQTNDTAIIGCKVNTLQELEGLAKKCFDNKINYAIITDAAKTELPEPTKTCIAIGPVERDKYDFLNNLELY